MSKVSIIGIGRVGAVLAYELVNREVCNKLVLLDINKDLAEGNCDDISQALCKKTDIEIIVAKDYGDITGSDVVVITAGKPRTPDIKSRLDLAKTNQKIIKQICENIRDACDKPPVVITLTNPMDIMNYLVYKYTGFPCKHVIGSGGMLDSLRFRCVLAEEFGSKPIDIEAGVIGEHGEDQVPVFSNVNIYGKKIDVNEDTRERVLKIIQGASMEIIKKKGCTEYAPATSTADMVESILLDEKQIIPCSFVLDGEYGHKDVSVGVPVELGKNGGKVVEWKLDDWEKERFDNACEKLKKFLGEIEI